MLPIAEIVAVCHDRGVLVLVDGAHVPGNIALDIEAIGVDWYVANLHKWAWAPRSCGVLWTTPGQQRHLRPVVIELGARQRPHRRVRPPRHPRPDRRSSSAPFAIDLMREFGCDAIYAYNHDLAWWAGQHLADTVGYAVRDS